MATIRPFLQPNPHLDRLIARLSSLVVLLDKELEDQNLLPHVRRALEHNRRHYDAEARLLSGEEVE